MRRYCFAFQFHYTFTLVNDRNSCAFGFIETFSETTSVMLKLAVLQGKLGEVAFVSEYRLSRDSRNNKRNFILILVSQCTTISFLSFVMIHSDLIVSFLLRNTVERILTISFLIFISPAEKPFESDNGPPKHNNLTLLGSRYGF